MRLLSEVVGALFAGGLAFVIARAAGFKPQGALAAVAVVPVVVAGLLAVPALRDGVQSLRDQHRENAPLSAEAAQLKPGADIGMNVAFFAWVNEQLPAGATFHIESGQIPEEVFVDSVGVRQAAILQWGLFQLAPHLAVEQSPKARDVKPGEGREAEWFVFYEYDPADYPGGQFEDVRTFAPGFSIARNTLAG